MTAWNSWQGRSPKTASGVKIAEVRRTPVAGDVAGMHGTGAHGDCPTRGKYASTVARRGTEFLIKCKTKTGLIASGNQDSRPADAWPLGFALMYLASVYGTLTKDSLRESAKDAIEAGIRLTAEGQSGAGGWTYIPGSGDEGSVTVTQVQAARAAHNSGISRASRERKSKKL